MSRNDWNDYLMHRKHKYIKKIGEGRNARYFYTMDELAAYYRMQTDTADAAYAARTKKNEVSDNMQDTIDRFRDERHGVYRDDYGQTGIITDYHVMTTGDKKADKYLEEVSDPREYDKYVKRRRRNKESSRRWRRSRRKALTNTVKKAIRGRSKAERMLIP